jgi:hypothetical protein
MVKPLTEPFFIVMTSCAEAPYIVKLKHVSLSLRIRGQNFIPSSQQFRSRHQKIFS